MCKLRRYRIKYTERGRYRFVLRVCMGEHAQERKKRMDRAQPFGSRIIKEREKGREIDWNLSNDKRGRQGWKKSRDKRTMEGRERETGRERDEGNREINTSNRRRIERRPLNF